MMKVTLKYMALFAYFTTGFFLLGLIIKIIFCFVRIGEFYLPYEEVMRNFFKSIIAGLAITLAAIIFNLIDKFNERRKPPSDPE